MILTAYIASYLLVGLIVALAVSHRKICCHELPPWPVICWLVAVGLFWPAAALIAAARRIALTLIQ